MHTTAHATLDLLPDGLVMADGMGTVVTANRMAADFLGRSIQELVGRPLREVLTLVDQDGRDWVSENCPYDGLRTRTGVPEQSWLLSSGLEVLVNAKLHRRDASSPVDLVVISLRNGRGRARLDRERSDLVATVAHELRSPLTGVKGFVQAMLNRWDKLSDEQKKLMLTTVNADADRLARLIAELLDVARIDTGRLSLYPRECDAAVLVQRAVDSVRAGTARPIELSAADALPAVFADPDKLTQVVTNLIENAVRHGEGTVTVELLPLPPGGEFPGIELVVSDEGEGIPEQLRRRVFTKFWTEGSSGGSGLGLYIVGGLTRAHGGHVSIGAATGGGARISVTWPGEDRRG
ncbi:PAS domain-containing sensor histidine kinase [uncultured Nocardioides sp.]|uniref:sensor histidine kinase n=2 Tax=uncultured Nocardioides sp. TaxID=198441 RepID=UPI0025E88475|nr:PAS domain-containing sensor histidine kinase [uncultured Nocardioides sp.]